MNIKFETECVYCAVRTESLDVIQANFRIFVCDFDRASSLICGHTYLCGNTYHRQQPLYNTLELMMMGLVVPETC